MNKTLTILATVFVIIIAMTTLAEVPNVINYQGRLTDAGGDPVADADYNIIFKIYDQPIDGTTLWSSDRQVVTVTGGYFNVTLGSFPADLFTSAGNRYLGITVGSDPEISPRSQLISVPYAITAGSGGGWTNEGSVVKLSDSADWIGIGTSAPYSNVDIRGSAIIRDSLIIQGQSATLNGNQKAPGGAAWIGRPGEAEATDADGRTRTVVSCEGFRIVGTGADDLATIDSLGNASVQNLTVNGTSTHYGDETYYGKSFHHGHEEYNEGLSVPSSEGNGTIAIDQNIGINISDSEGGTLGGWSYNAEIYFSGMTMPTGASLGYVLTSDDAGNGTWQALPSKEQLLTEIHQLKEIIANLEKRLDNLEAEMELNK